MKNARNDIIHQSIIQAKNRSKNIPGAPVSGMPTKIKVATHSRGTEVSEICSENSSIDDDKNDSETRDDYLTNHYKPMIS